MEMILPEDITPLEDIIVAVCRNNKWEWYLSDRTFWFMDYLKYSHMFDPTDDDCSSRFDIPILDENSADNFFSNMEINKVEKEDLTTLFRNFIPLKEWEGFSYVLPSLYLNFDKKELYNCYSEPTVAFENYLPEGWVGKFENFYLDIPNDLKYWLIDGVDYVENFISKYYK